MRASAEERGYTLDTSTRAMGMSLAKPAAPRPALRAERVGWSEYLDVFDLPEGLLDAADMSAFHILGVRGDGGVVATAMAYDHDRDCGIYNVGTAEHARRRGIATALTALLLRDAWARGCTTASVQATQMAEGVYAKLGFRDLGRFLEYVP
jgi:ribosomal protein S18 acetylase RimI-like enzyme